MSTSIKNLDPDYKPPLTEGQAIGIAGMVIFVPFIVVIILLLTGVFDKHVNTTPRTTQSFTTSRIDTNRSLVSR